MENISPHRDLKHKLLWYWKPSIDLKNQTQDGILSLTECYFIYVKNWGVVELPQEVFGVYRWSWDVALLTLSLMVKDSPYIISILSSTKEILQKLSFWIKSKLIKTLLRSKQWCRMLSNKCLHPEELVVGFQLCQ